MMWRLLAETSWFRPLLIQFSAGHGRTVETFNPLLLHICEWNPCISGHLASSRDPDNKLHAVLRATARGNDPHGTGAIVFPADGFIERCQPGRDPTTHAAAIPVRL